MAAFGRMAVMQSQAMGMEGHEHGYPRARMSS